MMAMAKNLVVDNLGIVPMQLEERQEIMGYRDAGLAASGGNRNNTKAGAV
jgi:hypothetical protein